ELTLAISHLGAVVLPINYRLGADEVDYILQHGGAKLVCVDEDLAANVGDATALIITSPAQFDACLLDPQSAPVAQAHPSGPDDMFRLMYTSGTTARPKGVIHTYQNFYWKTLDHICELGLTRADRLLVVGPLYHVGAFDLPGLALLVVGGSLTILRDFDAESVLTCIQTEQL